MDPSSKLDLPTPAPARAGRVRRLAGAAVLWSHRMAERFDLVPTEFGEDRSIDPRDAGAVVREWLRQLRLWAAYNPEELLALKAGAVALGLALAILIALVGALG
jgi:hypothetical protein